jgi:hypothetical protein
MKQLQTGDILLCRGNGWISHLLEYVGKSKYSHVGMLLYNPTYLCETLTDGWYVWDASYSYTPEAEAHTKRFGVQIHSLRDIMALYPNQLYVRRCKAPRDDEFEKKLADIHKEVHAKPYDVHITDWIAAKLNMDNPFSVSILWKHTDRFWCSALLCYIMVQLGWVSDVNWSLVAPREFSSTESTGQLLFNCVLEDEEPLTNLPIVAREGSGPLAC